VSAEIILNDTIIIIMAMRIDIEAGRELALLYSSSVPRGRNDEHYRSRTRANSTEKRGPLNGGVRAEGAGCSIIHTELTRRRRKQTFYSTK